jgi:hypothetical protein
MIPKGQVGRPPRSFLISSIINIAPGLLPPSRCALNADETSALPAACILDPPGNAGGTDKALPYGRATAPMMQRGCLRSQQVRAPRCYNLPD